MVLVLDHLHDGELPGTISTSLDLLFLAKAIERIGDHAKNIAEFIIYIVKGWTSATPRWSKSNLPFNETSARVRWWRTNHPSQS